MSVKTKKEKIKQFVKNHPAEILAVTATAAGLGLYAFVRSNANHASEALSERIKRQNEWAAKENAWLEEQEAQGKFVYLLHDLTYLLVPKDTPVEWINDRPKY